MVRKIILSRYTSDLPEDAGRIKIAGPLYSLDEVVALADKLQILLWTTKCIRNVNDLYETVREEYDDGLDMVADLLRRLPESGRYKDSEWCENGKNGLAACDAYEVTRQDPVPATGKRQRTRYFVKFAIGKTGQLLLMVSCHV
jgi:hypothetical protein